MNSFFTKKNSGIIFSLFFFLILSQYFHFITETILGRFFLISSIIFISFLNKFLGFFVAIVIIIFMNNSYMEGFVTTDNTKKDMNTTTQINKTDANKTDANKTDANKTETNKTDANKIETKKPVSAEGFNTIDAERNIQKGKQSNSIPVNHNMAESYHIEPYDKEDHLFFF